MKKSIQASEAKKIRKIALKHAVEVLLENGYSDVKITDIQLYNPYNPIQLETDLNILIEYKGNIQEDDFFTLLYEEPIKWNGILLDMKPITPNKSGTIAKYLTVLEEERKTQNYLQTAELCTESNYNQIDGILNNECPQRENQGYQIIKQQIVGGYEVVLGKNLEVPFFYVTWERNLSNDVHTGRETFFGGHYFFEKSDAQKDFLKRVRSYQKITEKPSILTTLKKHVDKKLTMIYSTTEKSRER